MTSDDLNRFIQVDNFKYLIVEATNESYYGFNLSNDVEKAAAIQVVKDKDDFTVVGWSIGKTIPNWVKSFDEWNIYNSVYIQVKNAGAKNSVDHEHLSIDSGLSLQQDDEAAEKDLITLYHLKKTKTPTERLFTTHTSKSSLRTYRVMSKPNLIIMLPCLMCAAMS